MALPCVRVRVDLDRDSFFDELFENISADVMSMTLTRGAEPGTWRVPASVLDLKVRNADHKYTPSNPSSIFAGTRVPGHPLLVEVGYPADMWSGAVGSTLAARSPDYDATFSWAGDGSGFQIVSLGGPQAVTPVAAGDKKAVIDFGDADVWVAASTTLGGTGAGIVLRYSDASNYLLLRYAGVDPVQGSTMKLTKVAAGTPSDVATFYTSPNQEWHIRLHGPTIYLYGSHTLLATVQETFNETATKHGIGGYSVTTGDFWHWFGGFAPRFMGFIDTVVPRPEPDARYAYLRAFDHFEMLARIKSYYANAAGATYTAGALVQDLMQKQMFSYFSVGWGVTNSVVDSGSPLISDTASQKVLGRSVLTELYALADDENGTVFLDGAGGLRFEAASHRDGHPHTAPRSVWRYDRLTGGEGDVYFSGPFDWDNGYDLVENQVIYRYSRGSKTSAVEVWRLQADDRPFIRPGETLRFLATGDGGQISAPIPPVAVTDYTMNEKKDGTGADLTTKHTLTVDPLQVLGNERLVSVTNNSGVAGYITFLRLRADKVTETVPSSARAENTGSQVSYGMRRVEHRAAAIDMFDNAVAQARKRVQMRSEPIERLGFEMSNGTRANLVQIAHREFSDRVRVEFPPAGVSADFHIERQVLRITAGGRKVLCGWELSRATGAPWGPSAVAAKWDGAHRWGRGTWTA